MGEKSKMKRLIAAVVASAMVLSLVGCGETSSAPKTVLSIGYTTASNPNDPYALTAQKFKEVVEEKTQGRITVNDYPSSQLGSEPEMWEGMQIGTCDMAVMTNAYVSTYVLANGALDLPFIFSDCQQARKILDGDYGQKLAKNVESAGVTVLGWSEGGFRQLATGKRSIKEPSDLAGMKIRCMETKTYLAAYAALGVNATPMAWSEVLTALQQGTIDGCDAPLSVLYTNGFPDVSKYINNVNLFYSPLPICISSRVLESFSEEDQQIIREAAQEAVATVRKNNDDSAETMENDLTSKGMTIVPTSEVDSKAFQEAAKPVYEKMESYIGGTWVSDLEKEVESK